ncbi:hypothetical protein DOY81_007547 [Sarcophaga bullata]|nr:hypothetical protein DOY81_007547 [Sarcophaga bullata]
MNKCQFPKPPLCLACEFPPCNCKKCKLLRCQGKPDREGITCAQAKDPCSCKQKCCEDVGLEIPDCSGAKDGELLLVITDGGKSPTNFNSIFFDIVGITSFLLMAIAMFWVQVCNYLWRFAIFIKESGRKVQITILVLLILLCCCITFHALKGRKHIHELEQAKLAQNATGTATDTPMPPPPLPCASKCNMRKKCCGKNMKGSCVSLSNSNSCYKMNSNSNLSPNDGEDKTPPNLCKLCGRKLEDSPCTNSVTEWTDEAIREMYQKFKLHSLPAEMKSPPSADNLLGFLSSFYNGISGSLANTLP